MAISLLQLAKKVLEEENRALTAREIWQVAKDKGYDKLVGSASSRALNALMDDNVRAKPSSVFVTLEESPVKKYKKYMLKSQLYTVRPGNKVRISEHVPLIIDLGVGAAEIAATKGSVGTILSYAEYSAHINTKAKDGVYIHPEHLAWVKSGMAARTHFPIRFEEVVKPSEADYAYWEEHIPIWVVSCQVGAIKILPADSFVVI